MEPEIFFIALIVIYGVIFFFDRFFKSCMHYPYDAFLRNTGLTVTFMRLRWHTVAFNRTMQRWGTGGHFSRSFLMKSFTIGVIVALSLIPIGLIFLCITIFSGGNDVTTNGLQQTSTATNLPSIRIEILLPGVNLPLEEVGFYIITMLCSTIVHEFGHALAAVLEDVPVTGFGFHLYFCFPLAYTEISMDHFNTLKWLRKLRICCAGIWHNVVFAGICYLFVSTIPLLASPFYTLNENVIITRMAAKSYLHAKGDKGLSKGNIITQINECRIHDEDTWYKCLENSLKNKPGFCVSSDFIRLNDESIEISHHAADGMLQCCDDKNEKLCCFEYMDDINNDAPVEIPQHSCLNIRRTIEDSYDFCTTASSCDRGFCLRPLLRNKTTILIFKRKPTLMVGTDNNWKKLPDVIYVGHPADVTRTVQVSSFVPKHNFVAPHWGDSYLLFLKYNIVFSIGFAFINAIPCFGSDGYYIVSTIINSFLVNRVVERPKRDVISMIVTGLGTILCSLAAIKVLWLSVLRPLIF